MLHETSDLGDATAAAGARGAERLLLLCGVAFAVAQLAALAYFVVAVASRWPAIDAPAAERVAYYVAEWDAIRVANALLPLPTPLFLLFLGGLGSALRRAEGAGSALTVAAVAAGAALAMVWPIGAVVGALAMEIGMRGGDAVTMQVLEGIAPLTLALAAMPRAVMLAATAAVVLRSRAAPRWLGWAGVLLAIVSLGGSTTLLTPAMFPLLGLGLLLFLLWVASLALALLRAPAQAPRTVRAAAAAAAAAGV